MKESVTKVLSSLIVIVWVSSNVETTECRLNKSHKKSKRRNLFFCRKEICEAAVSWQNLLCEDLLNFESTCNYHRRVIPGH